jgi:hypothetical protein
LAENLEELTVTGLPCDFWSVGVILCFPVDISQLEKWISIVEGLPQLFEIFFRVANDHGSVDLSTSASHASAPASIFAVPNAFRKYVETLRRKIESRSDPDLIKFWSHREAVFLVTPLWRCMRRPKNQPSGDATRRVVEIISSDPAKTETHCAIGSLGVQIEDANKAKDKKTADVLTEK